MDAFDPPVEEETTSFPDSLTETVLQFLAENGWYIFALSIGLVFLWKKLEPSVARWQRKREEDAEIARHHKDPDLYRSRQEAMEQARLRLQQHYDAKAQMHAEKVKEREEMKRQEKIEEWEKLQMGEGYRSKQRLTEGGQASSSSSQKSSTSGMKPDFFPLMGENGSGYRASRRTCPGGGCGGGGGGCG